MLYALYVQLVIASALMGKPQMALTPFQERLSNAAITLTYNKVIYDPSYFSIPYPGGDVPANKGVCTDVVIRAYRKLGVDLQQLVHEDMQRHFDVYPHEWQMKQTDTNIDHRRVPNIACFFKRFGVIKSMSQNAEDYVAGDIVCWKIGSSLTHIGIVVNKKSQDGRRNLIVHNIGSGQVIEDVLFSYTIIGHYSYGK